MCQLSGTYQVHYLALNQEVKALWVMVNNKFISEIRPLTFMEADKDLAKLKEGRHTAPEARVAMGTAS